MNKKQSCHAILVLCEIVCCVFIISYEVIICINISAFLCLGLFNKKTIEINVFMMMIVEFDCFRNSRSDVISSITNGIMCFLCYNF